MPLVCLQSPCATLPCNQSDYVKGLTRLGVAVKMVGAMTDERRSEQSRRGPLLYWIKNPASAPRENEMNTESKCLTGRQPASTRGVI